MFNRKTTLMRQIELIIGSVSRVERLRQSLSYHFSQVGKRYSRREQTAMLLVRLYNCRPQFELLQKRLGLDDTPTKENKRKYIFSSCLPSPAVFISAARYHYGLHPLLVFYVFIRVFHSSMCKIKIRVA